MANIAPPAEIQLKVGPYSESQVEVHFEPAGMIYELLKGDWLTVTMRSPVLGLLEIGHTPNAVIIGSWPDADVSIRGSDGAELDI